MSMSTYFYLVCVQHIFLSAFFLSEIAKNTFKYKEVQYSTTIIVINNKKIYVLHVLLFYENNTKINLSTNGNYHKVKATSSLYRSFLVYHC